MIASERRIVSEGETRHSLTKKLALSGRPVKIYVIDPKQFQDRLQKYNVDPNDGATEDVKSNKSEEQPPQTKGQQIQKPTIEATTTNLPPGLMMKVSVPTYENYKMSHHPVLIAPKEQQMTTGTTIILPPTATLLPIPMSLSLPIMHVGTSAHLGATMGNVITVTTPNILPNGVTTHSSTEDPSSNTRTRKKKVVKKKKPVKRKLTAELSKRNSISEEKAEAAEMAFLMKESTTRTGRVSKSNTMALAVATAVSSTLGAVSTPQGIVGGSMPGSPMSASGVTTSAHTSRGSSPAPSTSTSINTQQVQQQPQPPVVKKRKPPEKFKCQTCQRFYLGNAKFNQHFDKFPDHVKPNPSEATGGGRKKKPKKSLPTSTEQQPLDPEVVSKTATLINDEHHHQEQQPSPKPKSVPFTPSNCDDDSLGIGAFSPIMRRGIASVPNPDTLSDNCTSPKLPAFSMESTDSSSPALFIERNIRDEHHNSMQHSNSAREDLPSDPQQREYFMEFQTDFNHASISMNQIPNELIGNGSCSSQQSFNSLENLLGDSSTSHLGPRFQSPPIPRPTSRCDVNVQVANNSTTRICNTDVSTFFSAASTSHSSSSSHHLHDSSVNVSSYTSVNSCSIPVPTTTSTSSPQQNNHRLSGSSGDEESRDDTCLSGNHHHRGADDGKNITNDNNSSQPKRRSIWEFVKEQIRLCGINQVHLNKVILAIVLWKSFVLIIHKPLCLQTCGEISDMADKLSKIARDKFYPIQEEEVERLGNASPVIQVCILSIS